MRWLGEGKKIKRGLEGDSETLINNRVKYKIKDLVNLYNIAQITASVWLLNFICTMFIRKITSKTNSLPYL